MAATPSPDVTFDQLVNWMIAFDSLLIEQRALLTELDVAIGDGDHGSNMVRAMATASARYDSEEPDHLDTLFRIIASGMLSGAGGAGGTLFARFFQGLAESLGHVTATDARGLASALVAGETGIVELAHPEVGDKTLYDALAPAVAEFVEAIGNGLSSGAAARRAADAAARGTESTRSLVGQKGRPSHLGERSAGHIDPGAMSVALLFQALESALR
ncbi:dihydroxyacetone kinase subunit DhaL [Galbitalea soli]|uniref:Dihydroxyacetone kinase subunit L n=1 Tax=Galbitalea soli TaxID=1268042 RepID=A0A7C9TSN4_9MICO|nr:dihydroxyacetone kinase subunit DhaL [Galbitalea soli]NEM92221.1 dihydroxyacetone kinase subunit L [Galbitalea soli]NYJ31825.1 dihydroxyacetone kinase-like protein [Galbitalea soli]